MDWLEEKFEKISTRLRDMPLKRAMYCYVLIFTLLTAGLSIVTNVVCELWIESIYVSRADASLEYQRENGESLNVNIDREESRFIKNLRFVEMWSPVLYALASMWWVSATFYRKRLKEPFEILQHGVREVKKQNLHFEMHYDSRDEMGQLCESFDEMRLELIRNKEELWEMIEKQKQVNSAFAHDLRTPLTVLKGYSDLLERYLPEGKISEEKLRDTLHLMSQHIGRLEKYSYTMKNIQSMEEIPVEKTYVDVLALQHKIREIIGALNQNGGISILFTNGVNRSENINVDENIVLEVLENLLSNGIRYAETRIEVSLEHADQMLYLYVLDDGTGFSDEALKKATEPYYREKQEIQEQHYGIGLYICRILSEKHGGNLNIARSIQKGACVSASFSLCQND